jgi:carboxylate-amine ligase
MDLRTVGLEEEFLLVDSTSGRARAIATAVLDLDDAEPADEMEEELQSQQIETGTRPCTSTDELLEQVRSARRRASDAARSMGAEIAAVGTSPLPVEAEMSDSDRFDRIAQRFRLTARDQLTCGCHVHVGVTSDDEGVAVLDRIRPWLPTVLAITANSPFWQGEDSGYASYRNQVWSRWPSAGPTELFGSARAYHDTIQDMISTRTVLDSGMVYFDARLAQRYPTVEIRVADVCLHGQDAVLLAALVRALVETAARDWAAGRSPQPVRIELLKLAAWRAARFGLTGELLDPRTMRPTPAHTVIRQLLAHVRDVLEDGDEYPRVNQMVKDLFERGNGAQLQRSTHSHTGSLTDVVADVVRRTRVS